MGLSQAVALGTVSMPVPSVTESESCMGGVGALLPGNISRLDIQPHPKPLYKNKGDFNQLEKSI